MEILMLIIGAIGTGASVICAVCAIKDNHKDE